MAERDTWPACPHCGHTVDMDDSDNYCAHTTYWADDAVKEHDCRRCDKSFFIKEHVRRHWTAGHTFKEAQDT